MSTRTRNKRTDWLRILASLIVLLAMTVSLPASAESTEAVADEPRTSKSLHIRQGGRANRDSGTETVRYIQTASGKPGRASNRQPVRRPGPVRGGLKVPPSISGSMKPT